MAFMRNTLSFGLREASYWPKIGIRSNLAPKFKNFPGGACPQIPLGYIILTGALPTWSVQIWWLRPCHTRPTVGKINDPFSWLQDTYPAFCCLQCGLLQATEVGQGPYWFFWLSCLLLSYISSFSTSREERWLHCFNQGCRFYGLGIRKTWTTEGIHAWIINMYICTCGSPG